MIRKNLDWDDKIVLTLRPADTVTSNDAMIWHPVIDRFGIRFRRKPGEDWGRGVYTVQYFKGDRDRRMSLEIRVGEVPYSVARERAQKIRGDSKDPTKDPHLERREQKAAHSETFGNFVPAFLTHMRIEGTSDSHLARTETYLKDYFPDLWDRPVGLIRKVHISDSLDAILARNPHKPPSIAMTRARAAVSVYMAWLKRKGKIDLNPVEDTQRYSNDDRKRYLSPDELAIVWNAVSPETEFGRILRLIILTGARKTQIGDLRKKELDRDGKQIAALTDITGVAGIVLPGKISRKQRAKLALMGDKARKGGSKNGDEFIIPLSRQALALLDKQPDRENSNHVFGANGHGRLSDGGWANWSEELVKLHQRIGDRIDMEDNPWTLHDLRRTFATLASKKLKIAPHIVDASINHKPQVKKGVAGIYNGDDYLEERIEAMQRWADYVESLVKPQLKVVA